MVHVPAPNNVTTAPVAPALAVVLPVTEHTVGVVDEYAMTKLDVVDAEIPNAALPKVFPANAPNVIVCDVRLTLNDDDVADVKPVAENVTVKLPPAPFTFKPLNDATPEDAVAVLLAKLANDDPVAIAAVITVEESDVFTFPAASTIFTTGCVASATPTPTPPTGCV